MTERKEKKSESVVIHLIDTAKSIVMSEKHTVAGILLIVLGILTYITVMLVKIHFSEFHSFTKKTQAVVTMMVRNNDLMEKNISLSVEQMKLLQENIAIVSRNNEKLEGNKSNIDRNLKILKSLAGKIQQNNEEILRNVKMLREVRREK